MRLLFMGLGVSMAMAFKVREIIREWVRVESEVGSTGALSLGLDPLGGDEWAF